MAINEICQEVESLLPGYVLGALEEGERAYVTTHLEGCPACQRELIEYERVADALLHLPPASDPPVALRGRLARTLAPQEPDSAPAAGGETLPLLRWVTAAGVLALLIVNVVLLSRMEGLARLQSNLEEQLERNQTGLALGTYPTSMVAELESEEVFGTVVYDPARTLAMIYAWGLAPLPADNVYQIWLRDESGDRTSGGLFEAEVEGEFTLAVVRAPEPLRKFAALGVTIEPAGGSQGPSSAPVFTASLRP